MRIFKVPPFLRKRFTPNELSGWPDGIAYSPRDYKPRDRRKRQERSTDNGPSLECFAAVRITAGESV